MQEILLCDDNIILENHLAEMARVSNKNSGINVIMWASRNEYVNGAHWARIKVSNIPNTFSQTDNFSVSISKRPEIIAGKCKLKSSILNDIFDWVVLNEMALMKYWKCEYDDDADFYDEIEKL